MNEERESRHADPWWTRAACTGVDQAVFFPGIGESVEPAKRICDGCTVRAECLDDALENCDQGVRGGLSERARRFMKAKPRARRPIRHGTEAGAAAHVRRGEVPCRSCADARNLARREREHRSGRTA